LLSFFSARHALTHLQECLARHVEEAVDAGVDGEALLWLCRERERGREGERERHTK